MKFPGKKLLMKKLNITSAFTLSVSVSVSLSLSRKRIFAKTTGEMKLTTPSLFRVKSYLVKK